jgi:hypothetical protein
MGYDDRSGAHDAGDIKPLSIKLLPLIEIALLLCACKLGRYFSARARREMQCICLRRGGNTCTIQNGVSKIKG